MAIQKLGRYEIVQKLGRGTMGTVYKAIDPMIERTVAIKAINLDLPKDEFADFEERFYREAKSAGRLNHPNIVTIYDVGETDDIAYIAMEFLEGQSLRDLFKSGANLSHDRISEIVAQIADGLSYAQRYGIVHRDIKPANIMITNTGQVKITDFGIAHLPSGSETEAGTILGSPKYMSPEQIVGKSVDGRSDIFSLGVMLYEMLAGKAPFDGETISTIMYRILNEMPADIRKIDKRIPAAFDYIVHKALAKLPENRYQNASELAHDLRHYKTLSLPSPVQLAAMIQPPQKTLERRGTRRAEAAVTTLELLPDAGNKPARAYPIIELPGATDKESRLKLTPTPKKHSRRRTGLIGSISLIAIAVALFVFLDNLGPFNVIDTALHPDVPAAVKQGVQADGTGSETEPLFSSSAPSSKKTPGAGQDGKKTKVPPATTGKVGYLNFDVTPRGDIYVDGNKVGFSPPLKTLALAPGRHRVEVQSRFPPYIYVVRVNVEVNRSTLVKAQFQSGN